MITRRHNSFARTSVLLGLLCCLAVITHAQTIVGPDQMNYCDQATFTTTITNNSVTQSACLLEIVRSYTEAGVDYVPGSTTITLHDATVLTDDPTANAWDIDALLGSAYTLPPTESISISYDLITSCAAVSGTEQVTANYEDCDDPGVPLQNVSSTSIEILPGAIVVSKTPSVQDARIGDLVTWTITVENTGLGRVDNIEITDVLGPGLAYNSSTGGGSNAGQTTTWNGGSLNVGETVSVDLTAEVIACAGLYNDVDAAFGCGPSDICFDTAIDEGTATASLNLIVDNPALSFTPPNVTVGYCTDETAGLIQITNSGAGWARNVELCCDLAHLEVDPTRLPPDTTYGGGCFQIPDIAPGATFDLTFYVLHADVDWCAGGPSGDNVFELTYTNDCNIPFVAYPQFSTLSSESGPTLSVTKSGPASLALGATGSYDLAVEYSGSVDCGGGSPGPVTIVDTYPEGFTVVDAAGGTVDGGARTITWAYDPNVDPPFAETIQLEAPTDCGYCANPGASATNSLTATGTDCCGCPITGTADAETILLCEGDAGTYFSSSMALDRSTTIRCSMDYAVTVTHTYTFANVAALDDFLLNEYLYFVDGGGNLAYVPGSATVTGATLGTVTDNTPAGRLELPLTDATTVRGKTIVYEYTVIVQDLDSASCQASTIPINAGVDLLAGVPDLGLCGTMYIDPPAPTVTAQPPAMSVSITGIPEIQEFCATYTVTITFTRTSALAKPYDARLVLTNNGGSVLDFSGANCGGGTYSPTDGTTCTAPIVSGNTYEWRYADLFDNENDTAQIVFDVTIPCSGPLADLSVIGYYDDLCHDDGAYGDACSTSSADEALLSLSADVYTRKSPEILYATTRDVEWTLVVHNTGNAAAYNVWLDDTLGSGLVFDPANTVAPGATITANQNHLGGAINGATFLFDSVAPGQLIEITFAADLVACDGLTNDISVAWGCDGSDCQLPRTDDSVVVIPPANLIATSFSPTPIPMCSENTADVTVKNAGVATVYNIIDTVTLPTGLQYLGSPEVQVNGGGWTATGEPAVDGQTLTWTQTETPELASADPNDVIEIRFTYTVFCDFAGGNLTFQATYEDPCGDTHPTNIGVFTLGLTPASVSTTLRQIDPAPGEALDCGGQATWEIDVVNTGTVELAVVQVEAFLDAGLTFVSSSGDATYGPADGGTNTGQSVFWELEDLPVDATATFQVTAAAAVGGLDCEALDIDVDASWGCGEVDGLSATFDANCTTTSPATGTISAIRHPPLDLAASLSPGSIEACAATTELTLTISNTSTEATTSNVDFVVTLPAELNYVGGSSEIDCGSGYSGAADPNTVGQTLTWYDIAADGGASDGCESIPPGGTIRLRFDVDVSCYFTTQDIPITVYSYDCCGLTQYDTSTSVTLTSLLPTLTVDKSPVNTNLDCYDAGDTVTWTLTVTNNGSGVADWVRLVDTLGSSLILDAFTDLVDETPSTVAVGTQVGQDITWEADISLAPGESLSTTVTAHAVQPSNDCSRSVRRNTAVATWGCATLAAPTCEYGTAVQDLSTVRVPNLDIDAADITPIFSCAGDGVTPGSGQLQITVRNQGNGDAPITEDFAITVTEPNAGFSVSDTFVGLGGVLPLVDNSPQTLTLDGWNVSCANCAYAVTVTLDTGDTICECQENDNAATLNGSITLPDLVIDSANLSVTCAADGQVRIQGPVTLRNDGCGDPLTGDISMRLRLFDAADCAGNEIDTFIVSLTGLSIASGGGTAERTINVTRTLDLCDTCVLSIHLEADENDAICECDGANNALCAGTFPIAIPDLTITDIDFSQITCTSDGIAGTVRVSVLNDGCGASGPFDLRLATDGCLSFADETVANLGSGASTTVDFAIVGDWVDCTDCSTCTFTATVDPDGNVCECDGTNNGRTEPFSSSLPDLEISGVIGTLGCATDGQGTVDADVTVVNTGCADVTESFDITVTLYDGANCTGNVVDVWSKTISGETILSGGSPVISLTQRVLTGALCAGDCDYSAHFVVDSGDDICECGGTNNEFCLSSIPSEVPDLVVTEVDPFVDCQAGTASVTATVGNVGCGDATGVVFRLTSSGCAPTLDSTPVDLASGTSQDIVFDYTPTCADWNCTFTVTSDPSSTVCECDGANSLTFDPYPGIGSIGDRVWFDTDAEGDQDPGELGIAYVTVLLKADLDGDGSIDYTAETTTDANGEYLFDDLPAGDYTITVDDTTLPDGMGQTYDYDGLGTPHTSDYTLAEHEHNREQDFGYRGLGSIGDYVWFDVNADGVQDPAEEGIEGVTVTLVGDLNGDGVDDTLTTTTDADGLYLFEFLPAGPYTITVDDTTLPAGLSQTYDYDGLGSPHTSDYTLGAGEHNREQDFGYATPALSVDKVITDIVRGGASIGSITGPVEPGDIIVYQFTIENVGPVPAYEVGFDDTMPPGVVVETDAPGDAGTYVVSSPVASGSLGLSDGATAFNVSLGLTVNAGETLIATFTGIVTSSVSQGDDLTNTAHAYGEAEDGTPIPGANALLGDTSDSDVEDPDADDTGIVTVTVLQPALSVDKTIVDIVRPGVGSLGISGPVEPGDTVTYQFVITNVGGATAYDVEFTDTLPPGMVSVAGGTYIVSAPSASGSLGLPAGASVFTTSIDAEIDSSETLTAEFDARVTSDIVQGIDLVNTAEATGLDGFGTEIPDENANAGDTSDGDVEDPDADDTGIAVIGTEEPALSVNKIITDIIRNGSSIGAAGPVEPGDVVFYRYTIRNVGLGSAYDVGFTDRLPTGLITETDTPGDAGSWTVDDPAASGSLTVPDGMGTFTTSIDATIAGGGRLVADYTVLVTSQVRQGVDLINVAATTGIDGAGNLIPGENADVGDLTDDDAEDADPDDTGITFIAPVVPALDVDKRVVDVIRDGGSIGVIDPVLFGDVIVYEYTIRNVGLGTAYDVEFTDRLPAGLEIETGTSHGAGTWAVDDPTASGTLAIPDAVGAFTTSIDAEIAGGGRLTATYAALVRDDAPLGIDLVNVAETTGLDGAGSEIPDANSDVGDTSDVDAEDPDADDTGIASVRVGFPALVTGKSVASITRNGINLGGGIVEPGDTVTYEVTVANVGNGPALNVDLEDILPVGFIYTGNTDALWPSGTSSTDPSGAPGPTLVWDLSASLDAGETLIVRFDTQVTGAITQGAAYINTVRATGEDAGGVPIPPDQSDLIPEDDDPDDESDVSLLGAVPALVTDKRVADIVRAGRSLGATASIETGDRILYEMTIGNVGDGTAYDVDVQDELPSGFVYIIDSTGATWPLRPSQFSADPLGNPGPSLTWPTSATLRPGDAIVLTFTAEIAGDVQAGVGYTNVLTATGEDGASRPIPADNSGPVPEDDDPDDRDDVTLVGGDAVPAFVTTKSVSAILRGGSPTSDDRIEVGDVVRFEVTVRNVGNATAYNVGIDDTLPSEFSYESGSTIAYWPVGSSSADPTVGALLIWSLGATLRPNERIDLLFDARVAGPLFDGSLYINRMHAFGDDATGVPVPPNQRALVPTDTDPDDASQVSLLARSAFVQGEGGEIIPVPVLRKTAEILGDGSCEGLYAETDRIWFQTDIAMYASAQFEWLARLGSIGDLLPATLLPTWVRTVRTEAEGYAADNLLQVEGLSTIGLSLLHAPRTTQLAQSMGSDPTSALETRLASLAAQAGLDPTDRPDGENWIFLEYAGGEPIYEISDDGPLGPFGKWTVLDEDIVGSALGMSLLEQTTAAGSLLSSERALDRYVGLVLAEEMANKILSLDGMTEEAGAGNPGYVPHLQRLADDDSLIVEDPSSVLFDQASLIWGLASFAQFAQAQPNAWASSEPGLRAYMQARAGMLLDTTLDSIEARHIDEDGRLTEVGDEERRASTADLAVFLCALEAAQDVASAQAADRITTLAQRATEDLLSRQLSGWFLEPGIDRSTAFLRLETQLAGIRGLLAAGALDPDTELIIMAQRAFDVLNDQLWIETVGYGLYASYRFDGDLGFCYTPFDVGLATSALRELALVSDQDRQGDILARLAGFLRSIVDDAALQLANALPFGAEIGVGTGEGSITALRYQAERGTPAPVLQQRLCLELPEDGSSCAGRRARIDEPWYQTDISMYAAYVIQDRLPEIEDYADANLAAVVLHSTLGLGFGDLPDPIAEPLTVLDTSPFDLVAVPYAAGSPRLANPETLGWSAGTFDQRITASALGMTLLREAQELRQLIALAKDPYSQHLLSMLSSTVSAKLQVLEDLVIAGPEGTRYIPAASTLSGNSWSVIDPSLTLFGQLSLAFGLAEIHGLLANPTVQLLADDTARVVALLDLTLSSMEEVLLHPIAGVLVDRAEPINGAWIRGEAVSTDVLGLAASALERVAIASSLPQSLRDRAVTLLADEISFLQESLWRSPGVYAETWSTSDDATAPCSFDHLLAQAGALRALLAGHELLDLDEVWIDEARRAIEARFWDEDLQLYASVEDASSAWCVTPLEFGLAIDALDRASEVTMLTDEEGAARSRDRLARHADRILDGIWLQLPASGSLGDVLDEELPESGDRFAPVFDREVCLRPLVSENGSLWAEPGDLVRYTVSVVNETDESFANLLLADVLPAETTYVSSDPAGSHAGGVVSWPFERFEPGETRTWSLIARVRDEASTNPLLNCATLTYTDLAGEPQPPREACAEISLGAAGEDAGADLQDIHVSYRTDEAMRLAFVLDQLADLGADSWLSASIADELVAANLGALLQASDLGIPLREAPELATAEDRDAALGHLLASLAMDAGFPAIANFGPQILIPFEAGTPVLEDGAGFIERSEQITPAALGQTLACESAFLSERAPRDRLTAFLDSLVVFVAENQIAWLGGAMQSTEAGDLYLPHGTAARTVEDDTRLSVVDGSTTIYDQASLLLGLTQAIVLESLDVGARQLCQELALETLDRLAAHEENGDWTSSLPPQAESIRWADLAVAARACGESAQVLARSRETALVLLNSLADLALDLGPAFTAVEEAGRTSVLLIAGRISGREDLSNQGLNAWRVLQRATVDLDSKRPVFSASARRGLGYTPQELAVLFEMLLEVVRTAPDEQSGALATATDLLLWDTAAHGFLGPRVQLADPTRFWLNHLTSSCRGVAPVFGRRRAIPSS